MSIKNPMKNPAGVIALLFALVYLKFNSEAQDLKFSKTLHDGWAFIENKGQLADENGKLLPDIKYYGNDKGVNIYCRQQSLSFVFTKTTFKEKANESKETPSKFDVQEIEKVDYERMDMKLIGSNANAQIITSNQKEAYLNFYLAHTPEEGITNVHQFEKLIYKNIYNNIDMVLYVKDKGMKYEFVIYPGGRVTDINIKWEGTDPKMLEDGGIRYLNSIASMTESAPQTFFQSGESITSNFKKNGDGSISIETGEYDHTKVLIIDPTLNWATYYGGTDNDYGHGITADDSGYVYLTGSAISTSGIATSGAFQTSYGGGRNDGFLARFSKNGSLIWATYFGGSAWDISWGVTCDSSGIYITGGTESTGMATSGAYKGSISGIVDAFIAKFNKNGTRTWATYYGGSDEDEARCIKIDPLGKIYIIGRSNSTSGIATSGAYQTSLAGGFDVYVAKFHTNGNRIWATYYGGSNIEYGLDITFDSSGNVSIIGNTLSSSGIATSGAHQTTYGGGTTPDAFIAKFNSTGSLLWASYYGGSGYEYGTGIACDLAGNLYITGATGSTSGIATSGAYQTSYAGGSYDAYIAKFNTAGVIQWGTYYGGSDDDQVWGMAIDMASNIYITGYSRSSSGIATSGAYQSSNAGSYDAFITKFDTKGNLGYGTYYGGTNDERGNDLFFDRSGIALISGYTTSTSGIATSGAHQTTYGGVRDAFLISFKFDIPPAGPDKKVCIGGSTNIGADSISGYTYSWTSSPSGFSSSSPKPKVSPTKTTIYYLKVTTKSSSFIYDTVKVTVNSLPNVNASANDTIVCEGAVVILSGVGASNYQWSGGVKNGQGFLTTTTTKYIVKGTDANNCSDTASITIIVNPLPNVTVRTSGSSVCKGDSVILNGEGASSYTWSAGITDGKAFIPASTAYFTVEGSDTNNCLNQASIKITVLPLPKVTAHASDTLVCKGSFVTLTGGGAKAYIWSGGATDGIAFLLDTTSVFIVKGTDGNNCTNTAQVKVRTKPLPELTLISPQKYCCDHGIIALGNASFATPTGGTWKCRQNPNYIISNSFYPLFGCDPLKPAIYTLVYTYQNPSSKCFNTDSTSFTINPLPTVKATANQTEVCKGTAIIFSGEGASSYTWNKGVINGIGFVPVSTTTYQVTGTDINNCSDTALIKVIVKPLPVVTFKQNGVTITADQVGATYQWLDCKKNYSPVPGATNQSYTATRNGDYAVKVFLNDCSDTSDCANINTIGIKKATNDDNIRVFPNPAKGEVQISGLTEHSIITMLDMAGKILSVTNSAESTLINTSNYSKGVYLMNIKNPLMNVNYKLLIE